MNHLRGWWEHLAFVNRVALALVASSVLITVLALVGTFKLLAPSIWVPSLVCNLLTTGIAIHYINHVVAERERKVRGREMTQIAHSVQLMVWPNVMFAVERCLESPSKGLAAIADDHASNTRIAEYVRETIRTYGPTLDFELLDTLHDLQNALRWLGKHGPGEDEGKDALLAVVSLDMVVSPYARIRKRFPRPDDNTGAPGFDKPIELLREFKKKFNLTWLQS